MPISSKGSIATNLDIDCRINGQSFPFIIGLSYSQVVNGGRRVVIETGGFHSIEGTPLGAEITVRWGRGDTIHNLDFQGVIYEIEPKVSGGSIMAVDYIGQLARSAIVDYKDADIVGEDLYYLAADAANYRGIDTASLTEGSGIFATSDMELSGLKTRREFINDCFTYLVKIVKDDYHTEPTAVRWRYAIRRNNRMDFYLEDPSNNSLGFKMKISEDDDNLLGRGIMASLNTSQIVNSATFKSSSDSSIFATVTDEGSVERFGICSKLFSFGSTQYDRLEELAYQTVLKNKEPTTTYKMQLANAEHLALGDYVKVSLPSLPDTILPIVEVRHLVRNSVQSFITLGTPELSTVQLLASIT